MATQTNARKWTIAQTRRAFLATAVTALSCLPAAAGWRDAASPYDVGRYVLLAGLSAKGEPPHFYSGNGPSARAPTTRDDAIGLLVSTGPGSARVELPYPGAESALDVIELKR